MAKKKVRKVKAARRKPARPTRKAAAKGRAKSRPRRAAPPQMSEEAMMAAWQKAMTPGAEHQRLDSLVGTWRARTTFIMSPEAPPEVTEGTSENRWTLGGRHLEQRYHGTMMGMSFEGLGYTGYDKAQGKYVGTWMDTFSTGMMTSIGVGKPTDSVINYEAEAVDPTGKPIRFWCEVRIQDRDHHIFDMWTKAPNGRRFRTMTIEYSRQ
ncbi:MAG TPA: DUF1579 domain-containing protein [Candidatus Polarisedimenticolia bacterium]|jgi:hypothetical protein